MKLKSGYNIILITLVFELVYAGMIFLPFLILNPLLVKLVLIASSPVVSWLVVIARLLFIGGIFILLGEKKKGYRFVLSILLVLMIVPNLLSLTLGINLISWNITLVLLHLSHILGFSLLFFSFHDYRYLIVIILKSLLLIINIQFTLFMPEFYHAIYPVMNILLPTIVLMVLILGHQYNPVDYLDKLEKTGKKEVFRRKFKSIFIVLVIALVLVTIQSIVRTDYHEITLNSTKPSGYEDYSKEDMYLEIRIAPIVSNLYYIYGRASIGDDLYKLSDLVIMHDSKEDKDFRSFDIESLLEKSNKKIKLDLVVFSNKKLDDLKYIMAYITVDHLHDGRLYEGSLSFNIMK